MKPWIVAALVLLALIVLVSPGIIGRLAEENVGSSIEWAAPDGDVVVTRQAFERQWFTSEGTHRVEIRDPSLRALIATAAGIEDDEAVPAFIVETHIDHGLVPVTSMSRESGSLQPGLASAVSTLRLDTGDGGLIEIPGRVYTQVGLSGATELKLVLESGAMDAETVRAEWNGVEVTVEQSASGDVLEYDGVFESLALDSRLAGGGAVHARDIRFEGSLAGTAYGLMPGTSSVSVDGFSADAREGTLAFTRLTLETDSSIEGERLESRVQLAIEDIERSGQEAFDVALELASEADARAMQGFIAALMAARRSPAADVRAFNPAVSLELTALLSRGLSLHVERFDIVLPQGTVELSMDVGLPPTDMGDGIALPSLLLATTASADLRVPASLVDAATAANRQAASMVALGFLEREGDVYIMEAEYAQGLLTVNGAPMPLPIPAAR